MPRLIITVTALQDINRCRRFLQKISPPAARRAMQVIYRQMKILEATPEIGRPLDDSPGVRELIIEFGDSGYIARYRFVPDQDAVQVTTFRHQREDRP